MPVASFARHVAEAARRFAGANGGNIAVLFAIALLPILCFVGAAIDYSRANKARSSMQSALDSAALMLSKDLTSGTIQASDIPTKAQNYFQALYNDKEAQSVSVSATYTAASGSTPATVLLNGSGAIKTDFMQIAGFPTMGFNASSTTTWGNVKMRVALVLDNTGSMKDSSPSKISALKTAVAGTGGLIDQLSKLAANPGDVYISIVPFAKTVNVGSSNYSQNWIDWTDWANPPTIQPANGKYQAQIPNSKFSATAWAQVGPGSACPFTSSNGFPTINGSVTFTCTNSATNGDSTVSTIGSDGNICPSLDAASHAFYNGCWNSVASGTVTLCTGSSCSCTNAPNGSCTCTGKNSSKTCSYSTYTHNWVSNQASTWTGCVADRTQPNDATGVLPTSDVTTQFPANQYYENNTAYCSSSASTQLKPIIPLSYNWSSLKTAINAMQPTGGTNQAVGLAWGWQTLLPGSPLPAPTEDANTTYNRVIILLSDGLNTEDRWPEYGNGSTQASGNPIDARQQVLCDNLKNAKDSSGNTMYTIYTIQVNTNSPADPVSSILQYCASSTDKFYELTSSSQIVTTFNTIGTALSKLRVAR
jgi:Flp pilus assembly protein TadG